MRICPANTLIIHSRSFLVKPENLDKFPKPGATLRGEDMSLFVREMAAEIAKILGLERK